MNTSNSTDCFPYNSTQYHAVTILTVCVAFVSALTCLLVIGGIIYLKKYLFFTQRLILYLSIAAVLNSIAEMLRLHSVLQDTESGWQMRFCEFSSMLEQVSGWWQLLAVFCITLSVFLRVVFDASPERIELLFPALIFIFPLTFNWIPFIHSTYGQAGAWCWIRNENRDCSPFSFGQYLRFTLWYAPLYIILIILLVGYFIILCKIQSLRRKWQGRYDPDAEEQSERMKKEVRPLLWYPAFYIALTIFPLANRIQGAISPNNPVIALWFLQAISDPLQSGFVSVAYALDSETIRRLNWRQVLFACRRSPQVREYPYQTDSGLSDSLLPKSHRRTLEH